MLKTALCAALFALGIAICGEEPSQPPSPGAGPLIGKEQSPTKEEDTKTTTDQRGTNKSPLIVEIQDPNKAQEKAEREAERSEHRTTDKRIIKLTVIGVIVGFVQAVALVITFLVIAFVAKALCLCFR